MRASSRTGNATPGWSSDYAIADFDGLDRDCWFCGAHIPTVRSVLEHMQRIHAAELAHPIILGHDGRVMDGVHRICRAWLAGQTTIRAVRFSVDPPPDRVEPHPS